jgi:hypothetical protein
MLNKHSGLDYRNILYNGGILQNTILPTDHIYLLMNAFESWSPDSPSFKLYESITIKGYFQYLPAIAEVIPTIRDSVLEVIPSFPEYTEYSFLHIRRGDYLKYSTMYPTLGESYYIPAMEIVDSTKWIVLSDDIPWCKQQTWLTSGQIFIDEPCELRALGIMASCKKGAVIANSTFSWWGAVFSGCDTVVYPSKWFKKEKPNLFPESWHCI